MLTIPDYITLMEALRDPQVPISHVARIPVFEPSVAYADERQAAVRMMDPVSFVLQWRQGRIQSFSIAVQQWNGTITVQCIANCQDGPLERACSGTAIDIENCRIAAARSCRDGSTEHAR